MFDSSLVEEWGRPTRKRGEPPTGGGAGGTAGKQRASSRVPANLDPTTPYAVAWGDYDMERVGRAHKRVRERPEAEADDGHLCKKPACVEARAQRDEARAQRDEKLAELQLLRGQLLDLAKQAARRCIGAGVYAQLVV